MRFAKPQVIQGNYFEVQGLYGPVIVPELECGYIPPLVDNDPLREFEEEEGIARLEKYVIGPIVSYVKKNGWLVRLATEDLKDGGPWTACQSKQEAIAEVQSWGLQWEKGSFSTAGRRKSTANRS